VEPIDIEKMATIHTRIDDFRRAMSLFMNGLEGSKIWIRLDRFSMVMATVGRHMELERECFDEFTIESEFYSVEMDASAMSCVDERTTDVAIVIGEGSVVMDVGTEDDVTSIEIPVGPARRLPDDDYLCFYDGDVSFLRDMGDRLVFQWFADEIRVMGTRRLVSLRHTTAKEYEDEPTKVRAFRMTSAEFPQGPPRETRMGLCCGYTMTAGYRVVDGAMTGLIAKMADWGTEHTIECDTDKPLHMRTLRNGIAIDLFANWHVAKSK
jgi:hypothetical protein